MMRLIVLLAFVFNANSAPMDNSFCFGADEYICSTYCDGFAWCEMCDKCLFVEDAVYKNEL
jgi:hypothetical protein